MNYYKKSKPISNSSRNRVELNYKAFLSGDSAHKPLLKMLKNHAGRNNSGSITVRHKGGGVKRLYRIIDFKRDKFDIPATIKTIEYDPYRSSFISLVWYADGEKRYILTPSKVKVNDAIISSQTFKSEFLKPGNTFPLNQLPPGVFVHNIEMKPKKGGQLVRSAGSSAQILGKDDSEKYIIVKLTSGETRKIFGKCLATIGSVSNELNNTLKVGKAGLNRKRGIRPTVRGSVMNPNDHPHGGGEGKAPIGRKSPVSPWGKKTLGKKTRKNNKDSNKYIVKRRK